MTGLVPAAGAGRRPRPCTDTLFDRGRDVGVAPVGGVAPVEIDHPHHLVRGREIACRY